MAKLDRLARSLRDAKDIIDELTAKDVKLSIGAAVHDPNDPVGRLLFNVLVMVAEFASDLIRARTRVGMQVAKAKGRLRGKQPKLSMAHQKHLIEDTMTAYIPARNWWSSSTLRGRPFTAPFNVSSNQAVKRGPQLKSRCRNSWSGNENALEQDVTWVAWLYGRPVSETVTRTHSARNGFSRTPHFGLAHLVFGKIASAVVLSFLDAPNKQIYREQQFAALISSRAHYSDAPQRHDVRTCPGYRPAGVRP